MKRSALVLAVLVTVACGGSGTGGTGGGTGTAGGSGGHSGGAAGGAAGGHGGGSAGGTAGSAGGSAGGTAGGGASTSDGGTAAVINEICARGGNEYVELYNPGATAKDLSGYGFCDSDPDGGGPYLSRALRFPSGASLASHGFLLIALGRADAGAGPTTNCLDAGATTCFEASFNISNSLGETAWVLDEQSAVHAYTFYPANGHDAGSSYGRLPDGTGAFQQTSRTPGVANAP